MRGLRTDRTASIVIRGHAFVQNLRRCHYELGAEADRDALRLAAAFDELAAVLLVGVRQGRGARQPVARW